MFDFAWSEIVLIGVVALIAIGPKDLPVAARGVADAVRKARRMAAEFQTHVDDMMRDTNLNEVRSQLNQIRNFDIKGTIERAVDADGSIRQSFAADPLEPSPAVAAPDPPPPDAPAFIPPGFAGKSEPPPAFIPPGTPVPGFYHATNFRA